MDVVTDGVPIALTEQEVLERFTQKIDPTVETWKESDALSVQLLADTFQELYREKLEK